MKRWGWFLLIIASVALLNGRTGGTDVGRLRPVQVLMVSQSGRGICLRADTGDLGYGKTVAEAMENIRACASGEIFPDTVEYLLLTPEAEPLLEDLSRYLRPSCCLCIVEGEPELSLVGAFLEQHVPEASVRLWRCAEDALPLLIVKEGRMELVP